MKLAWSLGITAAVLFHAGVLLFGGLLFQKHEDDVDKTRTVDLVSGLEADKEKEKPQPKPDKTEDEELEADEEAPPDASEMLRNLDMAVNDAPALAEAS